MVKMSFGGGARPERDDDRDEAFRAAIQRTLRETLPENENGKPGPSRIEISGTLTIIMEVRRHGR